jgi:G patch domain/KOW motif-containing protein
VTEVVALIARPERLGLGARPKPPPDPSQSKNGKDGKDGKPGRKKEEKVYYEAPRDADGKVRHYRTLDEQLKVARKPFYDGAPVFIIGGAHAGMKGRVLRSTSDGTARSVVLPNEEVVRIGLHEMEQADDPDVLRRRAAEAKERDAKRQTDKEEERRRRERKDQDRDDEDRDKYKKRDRVDEVKESDSRKKVKSMSVEGVAEKGSSGGTQASSAWIRTNIRVKIVSKDFQGGKYYCKAGWVVDVLAQGRCAIMLDDTRALVEGFRASDLESVVPNQGGHVVVVRGEFRGEKGVILENDSRRDRVQVQLEENFEIVSLAMDDVAQTR